MQAIWCHAIAQDAQKSTLVQVAFAPLPAAPKPVATKAAPAAREPSRELTASEQFLAQARSCAFLQT